MRARAADAAGAPDVAAAGYAAALDQAPDDAVVAIRAYREGLAIGDYALASRAAAALARAGVAPPDTAVLEYAVALHAGDMAAANTALARLARGPLEFMAPVLRAWMAFDRGEDPIASLEREAGSPLSRRYSAEHRALLLIATHHAGEGMVALQAMLPLVSDSEGLKNDAALLLAATAEGDRARALQAAGRAGSQSGASVRPNAAFGASRLFLGLASDLSEEDMAPISVLLARAALLLDPASDRARLYLGQALSREGADRQALAVLAQLGGDSPVARAAASASVAALRRAGRLDEAIARAKALASDKAALLSEVRDYGELLAADGQYDAAAAVFRRALFMVPAGEDWELQFALGTALDHGGHWKEAQEPLRIATLLAPNQPAPLNYLGYALVEHGEDLPRAQALIERARMLKPDDAGITDSLAWAYYRRGDVTRALPLLERAARSDPGGTQVNEHLGDAYWRVGRRFEARYAWRAAAVYADTAAAERIRAKLANGLAGTD